MGGNSESVVSFVLLILVAALFALLALTIGLHG